MRVGHCSILRYSLPRATARSQHQLACSQAHLPMQQTWELSQGEEIAPKQNVALTLVAAKCQGEEQENTSCLHGQGDALLGHCLGFQRSCLRQPMLGPYTFPHLWHHPAWPAPPHSPVMTIFKVQGQHQVANSSLACGRMKASPKPMEVTILTTGKDWSCTSGVGGSLGSAVQAGKKRLCTRSRLEKRAGWQGK